MRTPIHPGEMLAEELEARSLSAAALARAIGVPANRVTQILKGRRAVTADTSLRLGRVFSMSPTFWLNLQKTFEIDTARLECGEEIEKIQPLERVA